MLKWTVSRPLSTASSTPHGPGGGASNKSTRKPFRDLSNTPPARSSLTRLSLSRSNSQIVTSESVNSNNSNSNLSNGRRSTPGVKRTPSRRKRCRSHGSDLRGYFQATKSSRTSGKRQSIMTSQGKSTNSPDAIESYYQSTPRVDTDIEPLFPNEANKKNVNATTMRYSTNSVTLPTDPRTIINGNTTNDLFNNKLQSHVSDFFRQISMATSPEDIIEFDSLPFAATRRYAIARAGERKQHHHHHPSVGVPKLIKTTKNGRIGTPYHTKIIESKNYQERCVDGGDLVDKVRQTPLAGKLLDLKLDAATPVSNKDCIVDGGANFGSKSVAEILMKDSAERRKILEKMKNSSNEDHVYESITDINLVGQQQQKQQHERMDLDYSYEKIGGQRHNDSSISSASQLLENPSPLSWPFCSQSDEDLLNEVNGEFPLKRQRVIRRRRRKRQAVDENDDDDSKNKANLSSLNSTTSGSNNSSNSCSKQNSFNSSKRPRRDKSIVEVIDPESESNVSKIRDDNNHVGTSEEKTRTNLSPRRRREAILSTSAWDTDSPKSSLLDSFVTSATISAICTPEAPLVATVRRCLKYSPETPNASRNKSSTSNYLGTNRGSIEIECCTKQDQIHVQIIRCRDLRRAYEGPINAYVKARIKDLSSGEGCVKRTAVHRATPNPVFNETLILPYFTQQQQQSVSVNNNRTSARQQISLDIAVWHRDRRARRSELLGCMTLPLPLSQDKEATWHPLEAGSGGRNTSSAPILIHGMQNHQDTMLGGTGRGGDSSIVSPSHHNVQSSSKEEDATTESLNIDNNNGSSSSTTANSDDFTYLRHLELEPLDPLTGLPLHPGFTARGGRTPCTVTRKLVRPIVNANQVPWGFSLSWGRPPRVERVDPSSPAERSGLRPGDYVVFVETRNVVTLAREDILELIQGSTNQLVLEVYRKIGEKGTTTTNTTSAGTKRSSSVHRPSTVNVTLKAPEVVTTAAAATAAPVINSHHNHHHPVIAFTAEVGTGVFV